MFTSGSTGRPKGVLAPHRALVGTLLGQEYATFGPGEVFVQCSPVSWDAFSLEFWGALGFGGTCVLQPGQRPEPAVLADLVAKHGITMLQVSSSLFNFLVDEVPGAFAGVRLAFTGGEAASAAHVNRALAAFPGLTVVNGYGPAESMGFTTTHVVPAGLTGQVPIGEPLVNKRVYVLDDRLRLAPIGVVGELYVGGVGLAHGYAGQPATTAQRFLADLADPAARMYRTGDLGRWTAAGVLEFAGRADDQVKIRGFRVEPGEVEALLLTHESITQAAVVAAGRPARLVAYVVGDVPPNEVRAWLAERTPEHLVPSAVLPLAALPTTPNGKLDRAALPVPEFTASTAGRPPRDDREKTLCGLFSDILGVEHVTIDDAFFDLGGHSLLAARLIARIRSTLGVELGIRDIFQAPTVATLALRMPAAAKASRRPTLRRRTAAGAVL
jgi:nonribosomal peptide synthetase DhbF